MGGYKRCNYKYKSNNDSFEIEAFMLGQEPYPNWFKNAMYDKHTVRVHYNKPITKESKKTISYVDLNTNETFPTRAYAYDMIIYGLIPDKIVSLPYEVFKRLFVQ